MKPKEILALPPGTWLVHEPTGEHWTVEEIEEILVAMMAVPPFDDSEEFCSHFSRVES